MAALCSFITYLYLNHKYTKELYDHWCQGFNLGFITGQTTPLNIKNDDSKSINDIAK